MGRILSGRRENDAVDPKGGGAEGRYRRLRIMRDITYAADDMLAILRTAADERMRAHVLGQIARLEKFVAENSEYASQRPPATAAHDNATAAIDESLSGGGAEDGSAAADVPDERDELEKELWG